MSGKLSKEASEYIERILAIIVHLTHDDSSTLWVMPEEVAIHLETGKWQITKPVPPQPIVEG